MMRSEIISAAGGPAPNVYFTEHFNNCGNGRTAYCGTFEEMRSNVVLHCFAGGIERMDIEHYEECLKVRRRLMADKIRRYYQKL